MSSEVRFFYGQWPFCVFESPLGVLVVTYDDHLIHWKARTGLLVSVS